MVDANDSSNELPSDPQSPIDMSPRAIEERLNKLWQLTIEEWDRKGVDITKLPFRKDVERVIRLHEK